MSQHQYQDKILPRYVDSDTEVRYVSVKNGAVRMMRNIRLGKRDEKVKEAATNIKSTLLIPNTLLPVGVNKCIGAVTSTSKKILVFFNWNSNNEHGIYMYSPEVSDSVILLYKDSPSNIVLGFHRQFSIKGTKASIVNEEHLFFTDIYNSPRYLNIVRANDYNKKKVYDIQQITGTNFDAFNFSYNGVVTPLFIGNNGNILDSNNLSTYFDIDNCECSIKVTEKVAGSTMLTSKNSTARVVPVNFYPMPHNERQIDFVTHPHPHAPSAALIKDDNFNRNFIEGNSWQFRVLVKYFDGNESVWSAWSKPINSVGECESEYNAIEIDYTDYIFNSFNDISSLSLIEYVRIGYRTNNIGNLYSFIDIPQCEIPKTKQVYTFYNDIFAEIVNEYDDKVKQYDSVPLKAGTLTANGNRILFGDCTEGYEEECFDFDVDIKYYPKDKSKFKGKISGFIDIINSDYGNTSLPVVQTSQNSAYYSFGMALDAGSYNDVDQHLGSSGFVAYLVGTDKYAITKQVIADNVSVNVFDVDSGAVSAITSTDKSKIWTVLGSNSRSFRQKFTFNDVKDGTYIVRIASHWVGTGDKLGKGDSYSIDNGTYVKTSTNIIRVDGQPKYEAIVTVVNGVMTTTEPVFEVEDCSYTDITAGMPSTWIGGVIDIGKTWSLVQGYVIDSESISQQDVYSGARVENATVKIARLKAVTKKEKEKVVKYTDHNGYFYGKITTRKRLGHGRVVVSKNRNTAFGIIGGATGEMNILWNNDNPYNGNLSQLDAGACSTFDNSDELFPAKRVINMICPFLVSNSHNITDNYRTTITGRFVNTAGRPISNVLVAASKSQRTDVTSLDGKFAIKLYTDYYSGNAANRSVKLILQGDECNNISKVLDFVIGMGATANNDTNSYDIGDVVISNVIYNPIVSNFYLKNGGTYDFGVTLLDRALRKTTVISREKHRVRIPFTTEYIQDYFPNMTEDVDGNAITATTKADGYFVACLKDIDAPPVWAVSLYAMRTQDQVYADYVQFVVSDVKYVISYREADDGSGNMVFDPITTSYSASDANEIYLDLTSSFSEYKNRNSDSVKGWGFEKGDRLRLLYKTDGSLFDYYDVEVKEQRGGYFVIENMPSMPELSLGVTVEIYRQKPKTEKRLFYETGEYLKVLDRYLPQRQWSSSVLQLNTGDAYRRYRYMYAKDAANITFHTRLIEDKSPSDSYGYYDSDIGRLDFVNLEYKQLNRWSLIRFGNTLIQDSNVNNIRRFDAESQVSSHYSYGRITILADFQNVIFVAQERRCHTRNIGKTTAYLGDGGVATFDTNRYISDPYYLTDDNGCVNGDSYVYVNNSGVFFDLVNSCICMYSPQNGINVISGYDSRYKSTRYNESIFSHIKKSVANIPIEITSLIMEVSSVYTDGSDNEVCISFMGININKGQDLSYLDGYGVGSNIGDSDDKFKRYGASLFSSHLAAFTYCYDTETTSWLGYRDYIAECYGNVNTEYIGFVDGKPHIMEGGSTYNNFFGTQYSSKIGVIANSSPSDSKYWKSWSVESNLFWRNTRVYVHNIRAFRDIESYTPDSKVKKQQGMYYAPFMFDINTPNVSYPLLNGERLSGEAIYVEFSYDGNAHVVLFAINIYSGYVHRTNF